VRKLQQAVREALRAIGADALAFLERALADPGLPHAVRAALPRCIGTFVNAAAGSILLDRMLVEPDGTVRYQILRTLGRMRREAPRLRLDTDKVDEALRQTVVGVYRLMHWRVSLEAEPLHTPLYELLVTTLRDKERHGQERLFRLLGLRNPSEEFEPIYLGLRSENRELHAGSVELIENLLQSPLREAVTGLVDDLGVEERLDRGRGFYQARPMTRVETLEAILDAGGATLKALAAYQVGTLRLARLRDRLVKLTGAGGFVAEAARRGLELLARGRADGVAYAG
jgi:hypothetical protein